MDKKEQITILEQTINDQRLAISQISHEIRNPVTLINSSLQLIEKEHPEVKTFSFWKETMSDMQYLLRLLNEVSSYNNSETLHLESLDTSSWLEETIRIAEPFSNDVHHFIAQIPAQLPALSADPIRLRQVLSNLLRNAFEALEGDGEVRFTAQSKDDELIIQISDTGCGIPSIYLDTLFQPFATHKKNGTGLGLAISKRIINAHRGSLCLDTSEGQGTVFTIRLPLRNHQQ